MKLGSVLAALGLAVLLVSCASYETPRLDAHYGDFPAGYQELVRRGISNQFHYPPEARFEIGKPRKVYLNEGIFLGGRVVWLGYAVDARVQAIERGFRRDVRYVVRLRNDEVVEIHKANNLPPLHDI